MLSCILKVMTAQNFSDVSHLIKQARDSFDATTWGHPEVERIPAPKEQAEYVELHEIVEHEPDADVAEYVEETQGAVKVPHDLQAIGVQATHVVQYPHIKEVQVPLEDDKIALGLKQPIDSAFRWLAEICLYLLHKAHIRLRIAHGKAERIFEK